MIGIPEGRRAWVPLAVTDADSRVVEPTPTQRIAELRAHNEALAGVIREVLAGFYEKGHPGYPARRSGWIRESTLARWGTVLEECMTRSMPELVRLVVEEQAKHVFAGLKNCACGFRPTDNEAWTGHRAAVAVEVVAAWIEQRTSLTLDEPNGELASTWAARSIREGLKP